MAGSELETYEVGSTNIMPLYYNSIKLECWEVFQWILRTGSIATVRNLNYYDKTRNCNSTPLSASSQNRDRKNIQNLILNIWIWIAVVGGGGSSSSSSWSKWLKHGVI